MQLLSRKPWDEAAMAQFLASPETLCLIGSVADSSGGIVAGLLIARKAADEAEMLTLRRGARLPPRGARPRPASGGDQPPARRGRQAAFLEVEDGNEAALKLYRSLGAVPVGKRPGYYEHGADAAIFSLAL